MAEKEFAGNEWAWKRAGIDTHIRSLMASWLSEFFALSLLAQAYLSRLSNPT
jgi:hypothetical protein